MMTHLLKKIVMNLKKNLRVTFLMMTTMITLLVMMNQKKICLKMAWTGTNWKSRQKKKIAKL